MSLQETIEQRILKLAEDMGSKFPIPPRTGAMIEERRRLKSKLFSITESNASKHNGWEGFVNSMSVDDITTRLLLCEELAENWEVPMSFMMTFEFVIFSEPSRMYVINRGMMPILWQKKSTPNLLRIAWDGALEPWCLWDVEDVITLPSPLIPINPEDASEEIQIAAWFADKTPVFTEIDEED
jgi:hypothetical protein